MKRRHFLCFLLCIVLLVPWAFFPSSAKEDTVWEDADTKMIWKQKIEYVTHAKMEDHTFLDLGCMIQNARLYDYFHPYGIFSLYPLLYTDTAKSLTFEIKKATFAEQEGGMIGWFEAVFLFPSYTDQKKEEQEILCVKEFYEFIQEYSFKELCFNETESKEIRDSQDRIPAFRAIIEKFGISREELRMACRRMRENPEFIRQNIEISDEDWINKFAPEKQSFGIAEEWQYEAIYLEDEKKMQELLAIPTAAVVDGKVVSIYGLTNPQHKTDMPMQIKTLEELVTKDLTEPSFRLFYSYLKRCVDAGLYAEPVFHGLTGAEMIAALEDAGALPPETGDNTPIFLTLTALSVLGLCALAVTVGRKKKERL